jgi:hypothetical protein
LLNDLGRLSAPPPKGVRRRTVPDVIPAEDDLLSPERRRDMTSGRIVTIGASAVVGAFFATVAPVDATTPATTQIKAPASACLTMPNGSVNPFVPASSSITGAEASSGAGRFRLGGGAGAGGQNIKVYCPVTELPGLVDITNTDNSNRVSIQYNTLNGTDNAIAQLCSDDNGWTFGGSCSPTVFRNGAGAQSLDVDMALTTNWHDNPSSYHYIWMYVPGTISPGSAYFTGYVIWHTAIP